MASVADDARHYLADVSSYAVRRSASAQRSITEQGEEVLANLGARPNLGTQPQDPGAHVGYGDVEDALERAKRATGQ
jgi:hypothetical protein